MKLRSSIRNILVLIMSMLVASCQQSKKTEDKSGAAMHQDFDETKNGDSPDSLDYKEHVDLFHKLFFTLKPDKKYIDDQNKKARHLVDGSGKLHYNFLETKDFFKQVMSSSAVLTIETDSIQLDIQKKYFRYYGKQRIDRKTSYIVRSLVTEGYLSEVPKSPNNKYGLIIEKWQILENKDIDSRTKNIL